MPHNGARQLLFVLESNKACRISISLYLPILVMGSSASVQHTNTARLSRNGVTLSSLRPGDLVKFHRCGYYHWAVYIGASEVVHISEQTSYENQSGKNVLLASLEISQVNIIVENFWAVAGSSAAFKANERDKDWKPLPCEEIVERALSFVGLGNVQYNVFSCNCEHFAKWCRYDQFHSDQVNRLKIYKPQVLVKTITIVVDAAKDKIKGQITKALDHRERQKMETQHHLAEENNNTIL